MANQSESRRLYSWWWDSHIPKNSKWIQENLADMDSKVKTMIKLIEADADSFARRAEMYYKKRPELMKLVEELYRAYRALAERYDHTTVELRRAHKSMVEEAFPNQIPFDMTEDSASSSSEPHSKEDTEVEGLKKTLLELQAEKEALNLQYQLTLKKLSIFEKELDNAQKEGKEFDERACKAEIENKILKESLAKLEVERDTVLLQYRQSMKRITDLEASVSHASKAEEEEAMSLKKELSRLHSEKEAGLARYNRCLELISALEKKIKEAEERVKMFSDHSEQAENEIKALKQELVKLKEVNVRYQQCLEKISNLEREVSHAQDNAKRLSSEVLAGAAKVKTVEEQCALLERCNQTLKVEAENLSQKMSTKDEELVQKQNELEKLQALMQEEHLRFSKLGASLRNLESLHSQSQEEQKLLTLELESKIQMLKEVEISSTNSLKIRQNEITCLKEMKEKLEEEVAKQMNQSSALQVEIYCVKGNLEDLNRRYQKLIDQVRLKGLDPESFSYSVKKLQDENSKLLELCSTQRDDKDAVTEKLCEVDSILKRNTELEKLLMESNTKLDGSREKVEDLQERCELLRGEKSEFAAERANLLSQLQIMTANMQTLLEKKSLLERSLSGANIELESLRDKSKCFEDFFELLKKDKAGLIKDRETLVSQLFNVEERLGVLEKKFKELEVKFTDLQCDKEELQVSLAAEKKESADYKRSTETRLVELQKNVSFLREECRSRKREFEEELDRVVNKQVEIFILQKIIEDLEERNFSLLMECQKYVEASEFSEKLISELESENLEQQMEAEVFLDEIDSLRGVISQVVKALEVEAECSSKKSSASRVLGEINELKCSLSSAEYEIQRLVVENSVLLSLFGQYQSDGLVVESEKQELLEANRLLKSKLIKREQQEQELRAEMRTENLKFESLHESYMVLQQDYSYTLNDNKALRLKFSQLKDGIEEENSAILEEAVALSNMGVVYKSFGSEMAEEVEAFVETLSGLRETNTGLKHRVETLEESLKGKEVESQGLNKMLVKLREGIEEENFVNGLVDGILEQKTTEILEAKQMLKDTDNANEELHKEVEELKNNFEESRNFAGRQEEEIKKLNNLNENLESEVEFLHEEIQRQQVREEYLSLELQEKCNEVGIWEAEATSFYFELQISSVRELLLQNKVNELTGVCENLKVEADTKTKKINQMKEEVGFLESQVTKLKTQLSAKDNGTSSHGSKDKISESWGESTESEASIKHLIKSNEPKRPLNSRLHHLSRNPSVESDKVVGVVDKRELSRSNEDKEKILERLLSDSRRLESLRISLTDLKSKLETTNEKQGRFRNPDLVIVKRQLKEMEEAVLQLTNTNEILSKEIEETGGEKDIYVKVVTEKSRNGSEKIEQLQNKMQNIEQTLLKLEDGGKIKGSKMFSESKTVILLRDIIHKGGKRTARKKKNRFCGCIRSSAKEE